MKKNPLSNCKLRHQLFFRPPSRVQPIFLFDRIITVIIYDPQPWKRRENYNKAQAFPLRDKKNLKFQPFQEFEPGTVTRSLFRMQGRHLNFLPRGHSYFTLEPRFSERHIMRPGAFSNSSRIPPSHERYLSC